ncbi:hypothetical protein JB92DRAFT_3148187 [Gautieria morchelliformis]|nr:hypothetical protein JB92DRAFT_3148187 [Gautieria morchelliformis]
MAPNESSSLSVLIERTRVKLKVRPDLRGALREEVEQWAAEAEELQAELHTTLRVEVIVDHDFERPSEVDDLVREVKERKSGSGAWWSRGPSKEPKVVGGATKEPGVEGDSMQESENHARAAEPIAGSPGQSATVQPVRMKRRPMFLSSEDEGENTRTPKKGCVAGRGVRVKDEKDGRELEVKERGSKGKSKGKAKEKGSTTGPSSISSKGVLGTRTSTLASEERMEELVERSEELMRSVSRKLNDLSGEVLE